MENMTAQLANFNKLYTPYIYLLVCIVLIIYLFLTLFNVSKLSKQGADISNLIAIENSKVKKISKESKEIKKGVSDTVKVLSVIALAKVLLSDYQKTDKGKRSITKTLKKNKSKILKTIR